MAAKGSIAKQDIKSKILQMFNGAFEYDKELRIPYQEDGVEVQIKVTLTCAKTNVESGSDVVLPGAVVSTPTIAPTAGFPTAGVSTPVAEVSEEEKKAVSDLVSKLGLIK